jgi:enoyl-[acyl-carrier protein] reductase / trans-2-enoyl-CoA reductase (NAD+)
MVRRGVHESITAHKFRLFKDMVYGNKRIVDEQGRIRLDHLEMEPAIQAEAIALMKSTSKDQIVQMPGAKLFIDEFYKMNGFRHPEVDYTADVDIEKLASLPLH